MPETTAVIEGVETKSGDTNGRAWTKYAVMAGGQFYSTFERAAVEPAYQLEGKPAVIEFTESGKFKNLVSVKAAENGAVAAKPGDGSWVKAKPNPNDARRLTASASVQAATTFYASMMHAEDPTPANVAAKVLPLAHAFYNWILQRADMWDDDLDVPF